MLHGMLQYCRINILEDQLNKIETTDLLILYDRSTNKFIQGIRTIWADNGDAISKIYAGTGATTSSVTRRGQNKSFFSYFDHGVKTIS